MEFFAAFAAFVVIVAAVWASSSSENNTTHQQRATSSSSEGVVSPQSTVTETPAAGTVESFKEGANAPTKLEENPTNEAPATSTTEDNAPERFCTRRRHCPSSIGGYSGECRRGALCEYSRAYPRLLT